MAKKDQRFEKIGEFDAVKKMNVSDEKKIEMKKEVVMVMVMMTIVVVVVDHVRVSKQIESNEVVPCHERFCDYPSPCMRQERHRGSCTR